MKGRRVPPKQQDEERSTPSPALLTWEVLRNAAKIYAGIPYEARHKLTMAEDVFDDYLILYGTDEGAQRMEADMLTFFRAAIADPDKPLPTTDDLYVFMKTGKRRDE